MTDAWDIDALVGETRSDKFPGKPFGFEYNHDMRRIESAMIAEGLDRGELQFQFEASRRYQDERKNDLSFAQRQQLAEWLGLAWAGVRSSTSSALTQDELSYLAERLSGANDPVGQSALNKILLLIK